jgi:predicted Zn-dependent protease
MDLRRQLWESDRQSPNAGADLIEMYFHQIELSRAHFPEAVPPLLAQAELLIAALDGLPVADSRAGLRIAGAFVRWGQILKTRDVPKAKEQFDIAYRLLSEIVQRQPGSRQARLHLSDVHAERAMLAVLEGRHADAILDWEQAIVLAPGAGQRNWSRIRRAQTLAECPVPQRAIDELTLLAVDPGIGPDDCLFLARSTAQAIARLQNDSSIAEESRATFINRYADLSVQLLAKAARLGFFREHPATDLCAEHPMFEGLRERDDFQALLAELRNAR